MHQKSEQFRAAGSQVTQFEPAIVIRRAENHSQSAEADYIELTDYDAPSANPPPDLDPDFKIAASLNSDGFALFEQAYQILRELLDGIGQECSLEHTNPQYTPRNSQL